MNHKERKPGDQLKAMLMTVTGGILGSGMGLGVLVLALWGGIRTQKQYVAWRNDSYACRHCGGNCSVYFGHEKTEKVEGGGRKCTEIIQR